MSVQIMKKNKILKRCIGDFAIEKLIVTRKANPTKLQRELRRKPEESGTRLSCASKGHGEKGFEEKKSEKPTQDKKIKEKKSNEVIESIHYINASLLLTCVVPFITKPKLYIYCMAM